MHNSSFLVKGFTTRFIKYFSAEIVGYVIVFIGLMRYYLLLILYQWVEVQVWEGITCGIFNNVVVKGV